MTISYPLSLPDNVGVTDVKFFKTSAVAINESPYTLVSQKQVHAGQRWAAEFTLPVMTHEEAELWQCFLLQLNGIEGSFYLGDPLVTEPRGNWSGVPVVDGAGQSGNSLNITGLVEGATIAAGDLFQIGFRLYKHIGLTTAVADSNGDVTIDIFPRLRESPADGSGIITQSPKGIFRLSSNDNEIYSSYAMEYYSISVSAVEAI